MAPAFLVTVYQHDRHMEIFKFPYSIVVWPFPLFLLEMFQSDVSDMSSSFKGYLVHTYI